MCGISGFISSKKPESPDLLGKIAENMAEVIKHRGPDDSGVWIDALSGVALSHRRLSIVDLSAAGHQPMHSLSGRYIIVLNGEIYNHQQLRNELIKSNYTFNGTSDTEVAINAIEKWGIEKALQRFVGMFAFAVLDKDRKKIYLARDRLGEKPLYYGSIKGSFIFASELKSICQHPDWHGEIDRNALSYLLRYAYIPAPFCIYKGIKKLLPGTYTEIDVYDVNNLKPPVFYWQANQIVEQAILNGTSNNEPESLIEELNQLLLETTYDKMIADVPVGAFLSGGIDSSLVVALMQRLSEKPVKTFSIGFYEDEYNEAVHAKKVAQHLGTEHTELYVTPEETRAVIPNLPVMYDEPMADSSQIPTFIISELARRDVTVALTGDGGDELFGGYSRYLAGQGLWKNIHMIPRPIRLLGAKAIKSMPAPKINRIAAAMKYLLPPHLRYKQIGVKLHKLANTWEMNSDGYMYENLISVWQDSDDVVIDSEIVDISSYINPTIDYMQDPTEKMMYVDMVTYLPDDILVKVDRASMAVSLETRIPLLDHRVVEYVWKLPCKVKMRGNEGKWLLRQLLYRYVPRELIDRPKMGFVVPVDHWLRGELREWAEALLSETRLRNEGYFDPVQIRQKWKEHLSGSIPWHYHLWPVLMFQAWHEHWMNN